MTSPVTIEMALVARFYDRLGDHAVNITRPGGLPGRVDYQLGLRRSCGVARRADRASGPITWKPCSARNRFWFCGSAIESGHPCRTSTGLIAFVLLAQVS
jgi:hypothetical protein